MSDSPRDYLRDLECGLRGSASARRELLDEVEAHIADAVDSGMDEDEAVARLGQPDLVSQPLNRERRAALQRQVVTVTGAVAAAAGAIAMSMSPEGSPRVGDPRNDSRATVVIDPRTRVVQSVYEPRLDRLHLANRIAADRWRRPRDRVTAPPSRAKGRLRRHPERRSRPAP